MLAQVPKKLPDNSKRELNFYILTKKKFPQNDPLDK